MQRHNSSNLNTDPSHVEDKHNNFIHLIQIQEYMQRYKMTFKEAHLAISQLSNPILTGRTSPTLWKGTTNNPDKSTSATPRDNSRNTLR